MINENAVVHYYCSLQRSTDIWFWCGCMPMCQCGRPRRFRLSDLISLTTESAARTVPKPKVCRMRDDYFRPKPNVCSFPHIRRLKTEIRPTFCFNEAYRDGSLPDPDDTDDLLNVRSLKINVTDSFPTVAYCSTVCCRRPCVCLN